MNIADDKFLPLWLRYKDRQLAGETLSNDLYDRAAVEDMVRDGLLYREDEGSLAYLRRGRSHRALVLFSDDTGTFRLPETLPACTFDLVLKRRVRPGDQRMIDVVEAYGFGEHAEYREMACRPDPEAWPDLKIPAAYEVVTLDASYREAMETLWRHLDSMANNPQPSEIDRAVAAGEIKGLVERDSGRLLSTMRVTDARNRTTLSFFVMDPRERGRGLGGRFFTHVLCRGTSPKYMLWVDATNPARTLYTRHGFRDTGKVTRQWITDGGSPPTASEENGGVHV